MTTPKPHATFEFEVEKVIGISTDGRYQVQWKPAWVSKFHLVGCEHLVQEFMKEQVEEEKCLENENQTEKCPEIQNDIINEFDQSRSIEVRKEKSSYQSSKQVQRNPIENRDSQNCAEYAPVIIERDKKCLKFISLMERLVVQPSSENVDQCPVTDSRTSTSSHTEDAAIKTVKRPQERTISSASENDTGHSSSDATNVSHCTSDTGKLFIHLQSFEQEDNIPLALLRNKSAPKLRCSNRIQTNREAKKDKNRMCQGRSKPKLGRPNCMSSLMRRKSNPVATHAIGRSTFCDVCKKHFISPSVLKNHYRMHTDERPFKCRYCRKRFRLKHHYKDHERIHLGEMPFCCQTCGRTFSSSSHLGGHRRSHSH